MRRKSSEVLIDSRNVHTLRVRASVLLVAGVSIGSTAFIIAMTVTALAAASITGRPMWSGLPVAAGILGTATGTSLLSASMLRWGRRLSLIATYALASLGALVACLGIVAESMVLLVAGVFVIGIGNSANALTRYVAADLQAPDRRATMIGWVVWSGTIGAVVGPNLLDPANRAGVSAGLPPLSGTYLVCALTFLVAGLVYVVLLRPDPSTLAVESDDGRGPFGEPRASLARLFRTPQIQVSAVALVLGHVVMVLIMTMTPLHVRAAGHGLDVVGVIASSHVVGMFVFSPVTGWLVDRVGALRVILGAQALLLLSAVGGMMVPASRPSWIGATLFFLGLGWNLGFVAGSAHLTRGVAPADRALLQGRTDSMVWIAAAAASLVSSLLYSTVGFEGLSILGAVTILVSATSIGLLSYRDRRAHPRRHLSFANTTSVHVDNGAPLMPVDDADEQQTKGDRRQHKEVHRHDLADVVLQEDGPRLRAGRADPGHQA